MAQLRLSSPFPDQDFQALEFKVHNPVQTTESMSGKMRRLGMGVTFYTFTVKYPTLSRQKLSTIMGYLSQAQGSLYAFDIILPSISYTKLETQLGGTVTVINGTDTWLENGVTKTGYATGRGSVQVSGASGDLFAPGDVFRFNDNNYPGNDNTNKHLKVYMATNAAYISAGLGTVFFTGGLVDNVPNGTTITYNEVPFQVVLVNGEQVFQAGYGGLGTVEFECREVWG